MKSSKIGNFKLYYTNSEEFHLIKREIWTNKIYHFITQNNSPLIIDLGAHIGISTLFFKSIYPNSKIICVEPIPQNLELLEININENMLSNISILPFAVYDRNDNLKLNIDSSQNQWYSTGSINKGSWNNNQNTKVINVKCIDINTLLENALQISNTIDLIKMDIEGSEYKVLNRIKSEYFSKTIKMIIEFHNSKTNNYKRAIKHLSQHFRIKEYNLENNLTIVETL